MVAHPKLEVHVGDRLPLGLHTYTVVGLTKEAVSSDGEALVYLSLPDAQEVLYQRDNEEVRRQRERSLRTLSGQSYLSPNQAESREIQPFINHTAYLCAACPGLQPDNDGIDEMGIGLQRCKQFFSLVRGQIALAGKGPQ